MIPAKFKLNLFAELERVLNGSFSSVVLSPVLDELRRIKNQGAPKTKQSANLALKIAEVKCETIPVQLTLNETVDDVILRVAAERGYIVATNDRKLRKRLRTGTDKAPTGIPVLYLRSETHIAIDGYID